MIDLHAHILPGIDDGPSGFDEALAMMEAGRKDGITGAVCSSHVLDRFDVATESRFADAFSELRKRAALAGIRMDLWLGAEIHMNVSLDPVPVAATIAAGGKFILVELPLNDIPHDADDKLFQLTVEGYSPILAHPERNAVLIEKPERVYSLVLRGVLMQVNAGSLTGEFGYRIRKAAETLLDHGLVHFIGTDCHNLRSRPMRLSAAFKAAAGRVGADTARELTEGNPLRVIAGEPVWTPELVPFSAKKSWFRFR
jgi:protein-tyrosine phosphatase